MATESADVDMATPPAPPADGESQYGGYSRFEIELEVCPPTATLQHLPTSISRDSGLTSDQFVQSLANPFYLNHLASQKLLAQPAFVAYLAYLQYWSRPPYLKYLTYPGPTLRHLELLQQERFRQDIMSPDLVQRLVEEGMKSAVQWHREGP